MSELKFPCSPEQEDLIADHLIYGITFGIQPDERAWILSNVKKLNPKAKVLSADLNMENAEWVVQVSE